VKKEVAHTPCLADSIGRSVAARNRPRDNFGKSYEFRIIMPALRFAFGSPCKYFASVTIDCNPTASLE
jgi:hypothetical protein